MVFSTFVKHAKAHSASKPQFFESSYPYLKNYNALVNFETFFQKTAFGNGGPHPSSTSDHFFGIDNGHYGLYYTMFNHEGDKKKIYPVNYEDRELQQHSRNIDDQISQEQWETFFILKVARETLDNVKSIQLISKKFLSPVHSPVKPSQFIYPKRYFTSAAINARKQDELRQESKLPVIEEPTAALEEELSSKEPAVQEIDTFESDLLSSQITLIVNHSKTSNIENLNEIYPIYQSLRRNDLELPSIEIYNIVLSSILHRAYDNDSALSLTQIESRLTNLLTVYQDIINSSTVKPTAETYSIVLNGLIKGCKQTIDICGNVSMPQHITKQAFSKSEEFLKVTTDLFLCIQQRQEELDLVSFVICLNVHSNLVSMELFNKINEMHVLQQEDSSLFYAGILNLVPFCNIQDKQQSFNLIQELYSNYKNSVKPGKIAAEFIIYSSLVQSLVKTNNLAYATKFVDEIMNDYKHSKGAVSPASKSDISLLLSTYLKSLSDVDLPRAFDCLEKFNKVPFIPEFSIDLYNEIINKFIWQYKETSNPTIYDIIWKLHSYIAIRKDYHDIQTKSDYETVLDTNYFHYPAVRDSLVSLSIDLGDHEKCFLLIKEILLKNHMIKDFNTFRKLLSYLHNGSYYEKNKMNSYYFELMWNFIETQSKHYSKDSSSLNYFLSGVVQFLTNKLENDNKSMKMILNSEFVARSFQRFRLETDNIYGLMNVSRDLMKSENLEMSDIQKIVQLEAYLINELEDTENFYLELSDEIKEFTLQLKGAFVSTIEKNFKDLDFSKDILEACKSLKVESPISLPSTVDSVSKDYKIDLSYILNINYEVGSEQFVQYFQKGYKFNFETWRMIINSTFTSDVLQFNDDVKISQFIERIYLLSLELNQLDELLVQLVELNNERVNIAFLKVLMNSDANIDKPLTSLLKFWRASGMENLYLKDLIIENFESKLLVKTANKNLVLNEFLKSLTVHKEFEKILKVDVKELDSSDLLNLSIIESVLNAHLELKQFVTFDKVFREVFTSKSLTKSSQTKSMMNDLLIKYFTYKGSNQIVMKKFGDANLKPTYTRELIFFNQFMNSVDSNGQEQHYAINLSHDLTMKELTYKLISCKKLGDMNDLYNSNLKVLRRNRDEVILEAFDSFVRAGTILKSKEQSIHTRFQTFLSFLKLIKFTKLNSEHLVKVIQFYSAIDKQDLINILMNKIAYPTEAGTYNISPMLDYYFFEIPLYNSTRVELSNIFREFHRVFDKIKDFANVEIVNDLCLQYKIALNEPMTIN